MRHVVNIVHREDSCVILKSWSVEFTTGNGNKERGKVDNGYNTKDLVRS